MEEKNIGGYPGNRCRKWKGFGPIIPTGTQVSIHILFLDLAMHEYKWHDTYVDIINMVKLSI